MTVGNIISLLEFCLKNTYFLFHCKHYEQFEGAVMGYTVPVCLLNRSGLGMILGSKGHLSTSRETNLQQVLQKYKYPMHTLNRIKIMKSHQSILGNSKVAATTVTTNRIMLNLVSTRKRHP